MKRTGIARGTTRMRRGRMKSVNPERKAKRRERDFGPLADFVRSWKCCACDAPPDSDPAHVKSRGAGGHAFLDNEDGNLVPFCRACHGLQHAKGWSAVPWISGPLNAPTSRLTAEMIAKRIGEEFLASGGERY